MIALLALAACSGPADPLVLHEWGWARHTPAGAQVTTVAPVPTDAPPAKPVIYLRGRGRFSVSVGVTAGTLREVWPTPWNGAQPGVAVWTWTGRVRPGGCAWGPPQPDGPACTSLPLDGLGCEAAAMDQWIVAPDTCLRVGTARVSTPALLYNAHQHLPAPIVRDGLAVTNTSGAPVGPVYHALGGRIGRIASLAHGETATGEPVSGALVGVVRADLVAAGLTGGEADDFVRAWQSELDRPTWGALVLLQGSAVDARLPLWVDPEPAERVRILAVAVD